MLEDHFYKILGEIQQTTAVNGDQVLIAHIRLNPEHSIFGGHFPGNPVVPGVCQIEMIREILGKFLGKVLFLGFSDNVKFMNMIDPLQTPEITFEIVFRQKERGWDVNARVIKEQQVFLKFKGVFTEQ
jgi:3-hydroxyacyl-[acyl-carrier-protein] dehydratase